jgi:hypothetical protein
MTGSRGAHPLSNTGGSALQEVRALFVEPEVVPPEQIPPLLWKAPDEEALVQWLVHEKQFSEERVRGAVGKMAAAKGKATQNRLESFFKARRHTRWPRLCQQLQSMASTGGWATSYHCSASQGTQCTHLQISAWVRVIAPQHRRRN